jgi:hypothetical protein
VSSDAGSENRLLLSEDSDDDSLPPTGCQQVQDEDIEEANRKETVDTSDNPDGSPSGRIATGVLETISQKYESLDYEVNFNSLMLDEIRTRGWTFVLAKVRA